MRVDSVVGGALGCESLVVDERVVRRVEEVMGGVGV